MGKEKKRQQHRERLFFPTAKQNFPFFFFDNGEKSVCHIKVAGKKEKGVRAVATGTPSARARDDTAGSSSSRGSRHQGGMPAGATPKKGSRPWQKGEGRRTKTKGRTRARTHASLQRKRKALLAPSPAPTSFTVFFLSPLFSNLWWVRTRRPLSRPITDALGLRRTPPLFFSPHPVCPL